ncbi:MAG: response regulator [Pirellulaceae bacterium]
MDVPLRRPTRATVLVVDDSPFDRLLVERILAGENITPVFAENGEEALQFIAKQAPDVVLTDLQMPTMDGLTLVRELKRSFPGTPAILMTGRGSEEIAAEALRNGAVSYVPKRNLVQDLPPALSAVCAALDSQRERKLVSSFLQYTESAFVLGYEPGVPKILVNHLQEVLVQLHLCDAVDRLRVGTALMEALTNAIDHGNLELNSSLREMGSDYHRLGRERARQHPYRDRRVRLTARFTPHEATFVIADEGPGFQVGDLPDPHDPANLTRPCGRGLLLMRTFMDEVHFNAQGNQVTLIKRRPAVTSHTAPASA